MHAPFCCMQPSAVCILGCCMSYAYVASSCRPCRCKARLLAGQAGGAVGADLAQRVQADAGDLGGVRAHDPHDRDCVIDDCLPSVYGCIQRRAVGVQARLVVLRAVLGALACSCSQMYRLHCLSVQTWMCASTLRICESCGKAGVAGAAHDGAAPTWHKRAPPCKLPDSVDMLPMLEGCGLFATWTSRHTAHPAQSPTGVL